MLTSNPPFKHLYVVYQVHPTLVPLSRSFTRSAAEAAIPLVTLPGSTVAIIHFTREQILEFHDQRNGPT
jgi:hypothetical protein